MNKNNRLIKFVIAAMLAVLMAGSATQMLLSAMGAPCGAVNAYLPATAVAVLCGIGGLSAAAGVGAGIAAAAMGGALLMFNLDGLLAVRGWIASMANPDAAAIARAGSFVSVAMSALLAACLYACISRPGAAPLALLAEANGSYLLQLASVQMLLSTAEADGAYIVDASENLAFLTACLEKMTDTGEGATLDAGVKQLATQLITFPSQQERQRVSAVLMGFWPVLLTLAMLIVIIRRRRL